MVALSFRKSEELTRTKFHHFKLATFYLYYEKGGYLKNNQSFL